MRVNDISYIFLDKKISIEFNKNLTDDSNTYSLILGNNGSGKSTLFEAILSYFSNEYNRKDIKSNVNIEGEIRKIILSTYSPYDRIRSQILRNKNRIFFEIEFPSQKNKKEEISIIYPNHSYDEILSLASSSYFKCKINDVGYFKKVEEGLSSLIGFENNSFFLLIESINQAKTHKLFRDATSLVLDSSLIKKVKKRLKLLDKISKNHIRKVSKLIREKNILLYTLNVFSAELDIVSRFEIFMLERFLPIFNDINVKSHQFLDEISDELKDFLSSINLKKEEELETFISTFNDLLKLRTELVLSIEELLQDIELPYNKVENYLLKCNTSESFELFIVLLIIKTTYKDLKSKFGVNSNYIGGVKRLLTIGDVKNYYNIVFGESSNKVINLDFDILESTNNFLIDDLIIVKNGREFSISKLSSGELSLFIRILEISLYIENSSLILIDEPEIHLNPFWINQYYYLLKECFSGLNCHFIIASQSPLIVGMFNKDQIFYLKSLSEEESVKKIDEETYAGSIDSILDFVFGVNYQNNPIIEQEVDDIKKLSEKDIFKALDRVNQMAYSTVRNRLISDILSEDCILKYEKQLGEID